MQVNISISLAFCHRHSFTGIYFFSGGCRCLVYVLVGLPVRSRQSEKPRNQEYSMAHKFPFSRKDVLDNAKRREMLPAKETLLSLGLKEGDNLIDVGCGSGYFSLPALDLVGENGLVLGLDVQEEFVEYARSQVREGQAGIRFEVSEENRLPAPEDSADAALLAIVLHEVESPETFLAEIKRILKPKSRVMIIEWAPVEMEMGPPLKERMAPEFLADLLRSSGFTPGEPVVLGPAHYGMVATFNK
jgi:SAM-dependent methyltransferase